ncbi:DUF917 domain-containing protein [Actinokineospora globicatena]|uniref:DUF917 domain-containing protein n=1 Tax=Actinokineospora globicatena TaxID=103729 RepID=UPI0020A2F17E|nr:DUF917 domain-containing protein [Actinokineospora globicatena]MCP2303124.1 hypothetical protein [Actinokineospora globicatena]GLW79762.1 hypothetical protein Aglo01_42430 [Actinokineospora globicatena]GLW85828.1 hypothetical protein Aglo02_34680 [Actinokineospora globicatena]
MWTIDRETLPALELGAALLGSGGGGQTTLFRVLAEQAVRDHGPVTVIDPSEAPDDVTVVHVGLVGAITAFAEKPMGGGEFTHAFTSLVPTGGGPHLVAGYEGAGANAFAGILVAAETGTPLLDVSGMGRALPRLDQTTYTAAGLSMSPFALIDTSGTLVRIDTDTPSEAERLLRANTALLGGWAGFAGYRLPIARVRQHGVAGTLRAATDLGTALLEVDSTAKSVTGARHLASGRVIEVEWRHGSSFGAGSLTLRTADDQRVLRIEMQSEFLVVIDDGIPVATTPDIICLLDQRSLRPIQAERVSVGSEVHVLTLGAPARWLEEDALPLVDPRAFGYSLDYVGL